MLIVAQKCAHRTFLSFFVYRRIAELSLLKAVFNAGFPFLRISLRSARLRAAHKFFSFKSGGGKWLGNLTRLVAELTHRSMSTKMSPELFRNSLLYVFQFVTRLDFGPTDLIPAMSKNIGK